MIDASDNLANLARYVKETRSRKGLSQPDIERLGGPSKSWVGALEAGTLGSRPKRQTLESLAKAMAVPVSEVLEAAGEEPEAIVPEEAAKFWESFQRLDPEDQEEIQGMIERRLRRIQREQGQQAR